MDASPFETLPREIRDIVYDLALDCPNGIPLARIRHNNTEPPKFSLGADCQQTSFQSLVLVSKQFHQEVSQAAEAIHDFVLPNLGYHLTEKVGSFLVGFNPTEGYNRLPDAMGEWLTSMTVKERQKIRSITLRIVARCTGGLSWGLAHLARLSTTLRGTKSQIVQSTKKDGDVEHMSRSRTPPLLVVVPVETFLFRIGEGPQVECIRLRLTLSVGDNEAMDVAYNSIKEETVKLTSTMNRHDRVWNQMQLKKLWPMIEDCICGFARTW